MDREKLEERLRELPIVQYEFFEARNLTFTQRVREVCRLECPMYGKSWACPPAVGTVEECRERCLEYPQGLLIVTMAEPGPAHRHHGGGAGHRRPGGNPGHPGIP